MKEISSGENGLEIIYFIQRRSSYFNRWTCLKKRPYFFLYKTIILLRGPLIFVKLLRKYIFWGFPLVLCFSLFKTLKIWTSKVWVGVGGYLDLSGWTTNKIKFIFVCLPSKVRVLLHETQMHILAYMRKSSAYAQYFFFFFNTWCNIFALM